VLIYASPGIIISLTGAGAGFANALSTHWIPNTIFFMLFVLFAASFFGAFEMVLPIKWANNADSKLTKVACLQHSSWHLHSYRIILMYWSHCRRTFG